jgi:Uma2 family endonuclease
MPTQLLGADVEIESPPTPEGEALTWVADAPSSLPTFDWEVGYRYVYNPQTGLHDQIAPLTLRDILYPTEDDIGVVVMPEGPYHSHWLNLLLTTVKTHLAAGDWLVLGDVLIHWGVRGVPPKAPDLAAIPGGRMPALSEKSYRVNRDGPIPTFVLEITSATTRRIDLREKPLLYAAVGIKELLIIDFWTRQRDRWEMLGYRLESSPYYRPITPDAEGGLSFNTVGLRFVTVGKERVDVYKTATRKRLLTPDELKARAKAKAKALAQEKKARAKEARARTKAETRAAEAEAKAARLEEELARLRGQQP